MDDNAVYNLAEEIGRRDNLDWVQAVAAAEAQLVQEREARVAKFFAAQEASNRIRAELGID